MDTINTQMNTLVETQAEEIKKLNNRISELEEEVDELYTWEDVEEKADDLLTSVISDAVDDEECVVGSSGLENYIKKLKEKLDKAEGIASAYVDKQEIAHFLGCCFTEQFDWKHEFKNRDEAIEYGDKEFEKLHKMNEKIKDEMITMYHIIMNDGDKYELSKEQPLIDMVQQNITLMLEKFKEMGAIIEKQNGDS